MTDPVVIGGVAVLVIAAIGAQVVNVVVAFKTSGTVKTIEGHVNSAAQAAAAKIDAAEKTIAALSVLVNDLRQERALLAQATASRPRALDGHLPLPVEVVNVPLTVEQSKEK